MIGWHSPEGVGRAAQGQETGYIHGALDRGPAHGLDGTQWASHWKDGHIIHCEGSDQEKSKLPELPNRWPGRGTQSRTRSVCVSSPRTDPANI